MHDRIAINHLCFLSDTMPKFAEHLHALGAKRVSLLAGYMLAEGGEEAARALVSSGGYGVETIVHPFQSGRQIPVKQTGWLLAPTCRGSSKSPPIWGRNPSTW
jgi:hypothetical protein